MILIDTATIVKAMIRDTRTTSKSTTTSEWIFLVNLDPWLLVLLKQFLGHDESELLSVLFFQIPQHPSKIGKF